MEEEKKKEKKRSEEEVGRKKAIVEPGPRVGPRSCSLWASRACFSAFMPQAPRHRKG